MTNDYYATLDLDRSASQEEIQKAYRSLVRKYHPDLNRDDASAKKKFQEVQAAFDVLSDSEKRKLYDQYGNNFEAMHGGGEGPQTWPPSGGGQPFPFDLGELLGRGGPGMGGGTGAPGGFADLFKNMGRGAGQPGGAPIQPGADIRHEITVPFNTAVLGGEAVLTLQRANGKQETIHLKIPAGIEHGKKIRLRGQGESAGYAAPPGDLLVTVLVSPHPYFQRHGKRLNLRLPITLAEAIHGAKIEVPSPQGTITLTIPPCTSSGKRLRIQGHGVRPKGKPPGDLFAEVLIVLPDQMTEEERKELAPITEKTTQNPRAELRW